MKQNISQRWSDGALSQSLEARYGGQGAGIQGEKKQMNLGRGPGPGRGMAASGRPKNLKASVLRLMRYLSGEKGLIGAALLCSLIFTGSSLAASYLLRPIINRFVYEPFIMSEFYHRNGSNYVEVLKDSTSDTVVTYIYTAGVPEANVEISRGVASFQQAVPDIPGDLRKEKEIISLFYHYRGTFYIEVLRDMVHDVVVVYVYPSDTPGGKMEVGRMKAGPDSGSDDMIISGMMLEIEEKIAEGRKVNGR